MIDLILISTTDHRGAPPEELDRMLASVSEAAEGLASTRIRHALLLQNCTAEELRERAAGFPDFVSASAIDRRISLSAARNRLMIPMIKANQIGPDAVVGFPDDDCWYRAGTLATIIARFEDAPQLDLWFCRYASQPKSAELDNVGRAARAREVVRIASSNTMFVRGRIACEIGSFDETLGVGTPNLGGEDTDFALKAYRLAKASWFHDAALIGHRDLQPGLRAKYYPGSLLVLGRHASTNFSLMKEYLRKIAVGMIMLVRRELSLRAFLSANRIAIQELKARRV
jgi:hypothetical protein